jgi:hypothetical protein
MKRLISLLVVLAAVPANAEETLPFKEELVSTAAAQLKGVVVAIDEAFALQNENTAPDAPFTIIVPTGKNLVFLPGGKKTGTTELIQLSTAAPDKHCIESLRLASLSVPLQPDPADRLKLCAETLKTQALALATKDYKEVRLIETYATKIGGNDAVCLHAQMTKPGTGEHYVMKLAGILHPTQKGGVLASLTADTKLSEIKRPEDLSSKGLGLVILHSIKFVEAKTIAKP